MPEITVVPGLRDVGNGPSEKAHQQLQELRQQHKVQLWMHEGPELECEQSWLDFITADTPDWLVYS